MMSHAQDVFATMKGNDQSIYAGLNRSRWKQPLQYGLSLFGIMMLVSCGTLNQSQCRSANWAELGMQDAEAGFDSTRIERHQAACSRYQIGADPVHYALGFQRGVGRFCTLENGWRFGLQGKTYRETCPLSSESAFKSGYVSGLKFGRLKANIDALEADIKATEDDLSDLRRIETQHLKHSSANRLGPWPYSQQFFALRAEFRAKRQSLRRLEWELAMSKQQWNNLRATIKIPAAINL